LIAHPVVVCNPRGIYFDHISHHILMFVLALSRGLPDYLGAQRQRRWDQQARQHPYVYLGEAIALIVGVGALAMRPLDSAPRWG
jgi:phosphoglycerate dehydrogenase-like enzyme